MEISLPYGNTRLHCRLDPNTQVDIVDLPKPKKVGWTDIDLTDPLGVPPLREIVEVGKSIAIVVSDVTRPCPSHLMLPPLINELSAAGVRDEDITVVFARGIHRSQTLEEQSRLVGPDIFHKFRCVESDPEDVVHVGTTRRGTPVDIFTPVAKADIRIAIGNVNPHYFAGYSGGMKALVPGVSSRRTIQHNHSMMFDPGARLGILEGNPVREDIEEAAAMIGLDFIYNVVLDETHHVIASVAGHPIQAHRYACRILDSIRKVHIEKPSALVIVSAGGYPKDINMYQAHKALETAMVAVQPGGILIWIAECRDGFGNDLFELWLREFSADEILDRIQRTFTLGAHKAAAIVRILKHARVWLISDLAPDLATSCGFTPFPDLQSAVDEAQKEVGTDSKIMVIPDGGSIIPLCK
jgi:nickel-dependent lactate racemase